MVSLADRFGQPENLKDAGQPRRAGVGQLRDPDAVVFSETGLLVGFFLPGDSMLFAAGFLASQRRIRLRLAGRPR